MRPRAISAFTVPWTIPTCTHKVKTTVGGTNTTSAGPFSWAIMSMRFHLPESRLRI